MEYRYKTKGVCSTEIIFDIDEETKAKEYEEKKSQEFNINTGDEKRYDDYVDINQN